MRNEQFLENLSVKLRNWVEYRVFFFCLNTKRKNILIMCTPYTKQQICWTTKESETKSKQAFYIKDIIFGLDR